MHFRFRCYRTPSSPSCSKALRIKAASASDTQNIPARWLTSRAGRQWAGDHEWGCHRRPCAAPAPPFYRLYAAVGLSRMDRCTPGADLIRSKEVTRREVKREPRKSTKRALVHLAQLDGTPTGPGRHGDSTTMEPHLPTLTIRSSYVAAMAHNRSPCKIRADALAVPLDIYRGWLLEVDCGGGCLRGRVYRVDALARAHCSRAVGDVVQRFRCQAFDAGAVTVVLLEAFERRRVPLRGPGCGY